MTDYSQMYKIMLLLLPSLPPPRLAPPVTPWLISGGQGGGLGADKTEDVSGRKGRVNIWAKTNGETIPAAPAAARPAFAPDTGPCSCHPGRARC